MDSSARTTRADSKKTFYQKLGDFLRKYRIAILCLFGVCLLAVIGVAVGTEIKSSTLRTTTGRMEKLEENYATYSSESDQTKKTDLEKKLVADADEIVKKWPKSYAAQRAWVLKAKIDEQKKDWAAAEKDWNSIVGTAPASYLAPVALQGAAVAAEEQGASDRATKYYKTLVDKYTGSAVGIPHAYFAMGRLAEEGKDYATALVNYQKIVSTWPDDDWTKLATDRILSMKSKGLTK
jgi:Uncharacterized protein conserved in bacteria